MRLPSFLMLLLLAAPWPEPEAQESAFEDESSGDPIAPAEQNPVSEADPQPPADAVVPGPPRGRRLEEGERERVVRELTEAYPEWVSRVPLGLEQADSGDPADEGARSTGPYVLVVGRHGAGGAAPFDRPALLFAGGSLGSLGDELSLALAWKLAEESASGGTSARVLEQRTLLFTIGLDPGVDTDLPAGWRPLRLGGRGTTAPFRREDSRSFVRFLSSHPEVAVVVRLRSQGLAPGEAWRGAVLSSPDRSAVVSYLGPPDSSPVDVSPWPDAGNGGGGLVDWAYQARGLFVWALHEPPALEKGEPLARWIDDAGARLFEATSSLARVHFGEPEVTSLGGELWCVEVPIVNEGQLPTSSALAEAHGLAAALRIRARGVRLVAVACARGPRASGLVFEPVALEGDAQARLPGRLGPHGTLFARFVVAPLPAAARPEGDPVSSESQTVPVAQEQTAEPGGGEATEASESSVDGEPAAGSELAGPSIELALPWGVLDSLPLPQLR